MEKEDLLGLYYVAFHFDNYYFLTSMKKIIFMIWHSYVFVSLSFLSHHYLEFIIFLRIIHIFPQISSNVVYAIKFKEIYWILSILWSTTTKGPLKMFLKNINNIFENVAGTEKASSKENLILGKYVIIFQKLMF